MNLFVRLFNVISTIYLFVINYLQFLINFFQLGSERTPGQNKVTPRISQVL